MQDGYSGRPTYTAVQGLIAKHKVSDQRAALRRETLRKVLGTLAPDVDRYLDRPEAARLAGLRSRRGLPALGHLRRD
jgi:hypothetical protein